MRKRITVTLPAELISELRKRFPKRGISKFLAAAAAEKIEVEERRILRVQLKEGYLSFAEEDLEIASDFYAVEQETYDEHVPVGQDERC